MTGDHDSPDWKITNSRKQEQRAHTKCVEERRWREGGRKNEREGHREIKTERERDGDATMPIKSPQAIW